MLPSGKATDFDSVTRRFEPCHPSIGKVAEWSIAPDLKSGESYKLSVGSNPTFSLLLKI